MDVRELITELLDCNLEVDVDLELEANGDSYYDTVFEVEETNELVTLKFRSTEMVLIDKDDLQEMNDRIEELEDELNDKQQ